MELDDNVCLLHEQMSPQVNGLSRRCTVSAAGVFNLCFGNGRCSKLYTCLLDADPIYGLRVAGPKIAYAFTLNPIYSTFLTFIREHALAPSFCSTFFPFFTCFDFQSASTPCAYKTIDVYAQLHKVLYQL